MMKSVYNKQVYQTNLRFWGRKFMSTPVMPTVRPLTCLSEEEALFRSTIRDFAETVVAPLVASMDETSQYDPALLPQLFELGLMGIEIPEAYGGAGGSFL